MFKPHLCVNADLDKLTFPIVCLTKMDGCRMLVREGHALGRSLKAYKNKRLTTHFSQDIFSGCDGELLYGEPSDNLLCNNTTSCVNTIEGHLPKYYMIFDYLTDNTIDLGYAERWEILQANIADIAKAAMPVQVFLPDYVVCNSVEEVMEFYQSCLDKGYEGIIIRDPNGKHKDGRCTVKEGAYMRIKPTEDAEGIVLRLEEAYENQNEAKINELGQTERSSHKDNKVPKGMIGAIWISTPEGEMKIGAGKMTHDMRKYYFNHPDEIIGQIVKYACLGTGKKDKIRHGRFISFRSKEDMS